MSSEIIVREFEPCSRCGHGLGRHQPITGRPCEICDCAAYARTTNPSSRRIGPREVPN